MCRCNINRYRLTDKHKEAVLEKLQRLRTLREGNHRLREEKVNTVIQKKPEITQLRIIRDKYLQRIKQLKEQMQNIDQAIKIGSYRYCYKTNEFLERAKVEAQKQQNHSRKKTLLDAKSELVQLSTQLDKNRSSSLRHFYLEEKKTFDKLAQHRKYLIAELCSFYPVMPLSESECVILNIKLPNSSGLWPDFPPEVLSAALGYLVHMLNIIILYLNICVPYRMEFCGSRSLIWRDGSA
jgi:hypothetical protein